MEYGLAALAALTLVALASTWTQRALFLQAMPGAAAVMSLIESGLALAGISMTYQADLLTTPVALAITATASLIACLISSYIVRPRLGPRVRAVSSKR